MNKLSRLAAPVAAAVALLAAPTLPAFAAPAKPAKAFVHPELQKAKAQAAQLRAHYKAARKRLGAQAGPEDVTPPALTAFNADNRVNLRKHGEEANVSWTLSDDLSGGYYIYAQLSGPSGQTTAISRSIYYSDTAWTDKGRFYLDHSAEPGNWTVDRVYAYDMRGNFVEYDAAALAALGNNVIKVSNKTYDVLPPALVSGEVLTPTVTLSKNPPGMPYTFGDDFKVRITAGDTAGGAIVSGVRYAYLYFCIWDGASCTHGLSLSLDSGVWGDPQDVFTLGHRLTPGWQTGVYALDSVQIYDNAGNWVGYWSVDHGGETDFSTMFPGGTSFEVLP